MTNMKKCPAQPPRLRVRPVGRGPRQGRVEREARRVPHLYYLFSFFEPPTRSVHGGWYSITQPPCTRHQGG